MQIGLWGMRQVQTRSLDGEVGAVRGGGTGSFPGGGDMKGIKGREVGGGREFLV